MSRPGIEFHQRPLTEPERRLLRCHLRHLNRERAKRWLRAFGMTGIVVGILWLMTVLASDAPLWVISSFWGLSWLALAVWVGREGSAWAIERIGGVERALEQGSVAVMRIEALRYAKIEEVEDEGAYLVLELPGRALTFLSCQDSYPTLRFPSAEIEYNRILGPDAEEVLTLRRCRGPRLTLERTIPAGIKDRMTWPGDLVVRSGTLDDLEDVLKGTGD